MKNKIITVTQENEKVPYLPKMSLSSTIPSHQFVTVTLVLL
jgi:hypothetical protein